MDVKQLVEDFSVNTLKNFFRREIPTFRSEEEDYCYPFEGMSNILDNYSNIVKIGEAELNNSNEILVITAKVNSSLTNKSSKKRQYEVAKKILKQENYDAAFFIFYDENKNFRFSFIRTNYIGARRDFTNFKRYTYFVSPYQTNKTFIQRISQCEFRDLDSIQEAFSVEPVTKEFYTKLQRWYFWALRNVKFHEDAEKERNGREMAVIRLITRIVFIWFMKVRGLIPESLFNEEKLRNILNDFSDESSTYYRAILQNLFFATLNTKQRERKFRSEKRWHRGYNPDFGNHNVFRYHYLFRENVSLENIFNDIPFLNGGLFECLDYKSKKKEDRKYIDGFTDLKQYQPHVPNFLFFSIERKVDLSNFFGERNRTYEVEGLINILNSYNFTIDENEPDDVEVALDPELLGEIFENLLASYNPETATTARKATGSFYTPREIVNYMTMETLKYYFKLHLEDIPDIDKKLDLLIKHEDINPFDESISRRIVSLIDNLRIVDPAVGSGAFPMAMLNKLVFILGKLDPSNEYWKQSQMESIERTVDDSVVRQKLLEQMVKQFQEKDADYGRKLYLIEKCIYGVDIQEIAIEIAKLRFFISLLVDEKIDRQKENYGIEPLPNLDFKLMQGNSLIEVINPNLLSYNRDEERNKLVKILKEKKEKLFRISDYNEKKLLKGEIHSLINKIFEHDKKVEIEKLKKEIEEWKNLRTLFPSMQDKKTAESEIKKCEEKIKEISRDIISAEKHFEWHINFAEVFTEKGGFDIVIGNPPYIQLQKALDERQKFADLYKSENYETFERTGDIYTLFYEKGIKILNEKGLLCFISSNKWMRANYGKSLRRFFARHNPLILIDLGPRVFNNATVDTSILLIQKRNNDKIKTKGVTLKEKNKINSLNDEDFIVLTDLGERSWIILSPIEQKIKRKIEEIGTPLRDWNIQINYGIKTGYNEAFIIDGKTKEELIKKDPKSAEIIKPILRGRDIKRYKAEFADLWLINTHNGYKNSKGEYIPPINVNDYPAIKEHLDKYWDKLKKRQDKGITPYNLRNCAYLEEFEKEKIVYQEIVRGAQFYFDRNKYYVEATAFILTGKKAKYLITLLNSDPLTYFFRNFYAGGGLGDNGYRYKKIFIQALPIPKISLDKQKPFETLVDYILFLKEHGEEEKSLFFEDLIDGMVYELYFKEEIRRADCEVLKYLENLPEITDEVSDEKKIKIITHVYSTLSDKNRHVFKNLEKMKKEVGEVRIIEESLKK